MTAEWLHRSHGDAASLHIRIAASAWTVGQLNDIDLAMASNRGGVSRQLGKEFAGIARQLLPQRLDRVEHRSLARRVVTEKQPGRD